MPKKSKRICPYCKTDRYKSLRESKYCRACGNRIWSALDEWVTDEYHDYCILLVNLLELHKAKRLGDDEYELTATERRFEMRNAATLLKKCGDDIQLALGVFEAKVARTKGGHYVHSLSWVIGRGFSDDLSTARRKMAKQVQEDKRVQAAASISSSRGDLFGEDQKRGVDSTGRPVNRGAGSKG